jgi:Methyltransferase FkbM domain
MQGQAHNGRLDFIKLDIEGAEKQILDDPGSREILCHARCIFMELHDSFQDGCTQSFQTFLDGGCKGMGEHLEQGLVQVARTGEYTLACQGLVSLADAQQ